MINRIQQLFDYLKVIIVICCRFLLARKQAAAFLLSNSLWQIFFAIKMLPSLS